MHAVFTNVSLFATKVVNVANVLKACLEIVRVGKQVNLLFSRTHCKTSVYKILTKESKKPCTEEIGPCGDNCDKKLNCDLHACTMRCHFGPCDPVCFS